MKEKLRSLFYLFTPLIGGGLVGLIIQNSIDYNNLSLPPFSPPSYLFPIAWTILYLLIGISYFLYRKEHNDPRTKKLYYTQLIVNFLWSILFFTLKCYFFSILWIGFLILLVFWLIYRYYQENKVSATLLIPYALWLLFALYLTIGVFLLN